MKTITVNPLDGSWEVTPDYELMDWYEDERSDYFCPYTNMENDCGRD